MRIIGTQALTYLSRVCKVMLSIVSLVCICVKRMLINATLSLLLLAKRTLNLAKLANYPLFAKNSTR